MEQPTEPPIDIEELLENLQLVAGGLDNHTRDAIRIAQASKLNPLRHLLEGHYGLEHTLPGPSGVMACRRRQWYEFTKTPRDWPGSGMWRFAAAKGSYFEPLYAVLLELSDPRLAVTEAETELIKEYEQTRPEVRGTPDGYLNKINALVEFKTVSAYSFEKFRANGCEAESPDYWMQAQLYLHATGRPWSLFMVFPHDGSAARNVRGNSLSGDARKAHNENRRGYLPHLICYGEWIPYDRQTALDGIERMKMIQDDQTAGAPPRRDFDPTRRKFEKDEKPHPCWSICPWTQTCLEQGS